MTKAQVLKATFRVLNLKLAKAGIPLLVCNHVYDVVGSYIPQKEMSGGSGLKYSASTIVNLTKRKERIDTEVIGNIIKCRTEKSRLSKENKVVEVLLTYEHGLDRYYGLVDLAVEAGLFKKVATRIELPDGTKQYAKTIYANPEKYFTEELLVALEEYAKKEYQYGLGNDDIVSEEVVDETEEIVEKLDLIDSEGE
jgi:hypothetical protein